MRIHLLGALLAGVLMSSTQAHAQTWENPYRIQTSPYYSNQYSCAFAPQLLYMDNGAFPIYAPAVVYRIEQRTIGHIPPRPWSVSLAPEDWSDLSLWVCQQKNGNLVSECVDASDEYGNGVPEHVTVPPVPGAYYIIVTGNIEQQSPLCGPYVLTAMH